MSSPEELIDSQRQRICALKEQIQLYEAQIATFNELVEKQEGLIEMLSSFDLTLCNPSIN